MHLNKKSPKLRLSHLSLLLFRIEFLRFLPSPREKQDAEHFYNFRAYKPVIKLEVLFLYFLDPKKQPTNRHQSFLVCGSSTRPSFRTRSIYRSVPHAIQPTTLLDSIFFMTMLSETVKRLSLRGHVIAGYSDCLVDLHFTCIRCCMPRCVFELLTFGGRSLHDTLHDWKLPISAVFRK